MHAQRPADTAISFENGARDEIACLDVIKTPHSQGLK